MIQKTLRLIFRSLLWTIVTLLLLPVIYFMARMRQPLSPLEFQGRSYIQYLAQHRQVSEAAIQEYTSQHPDFHYQGIGSPLTVCHSTRAFITSFVGPLQSLGYTAAALSGMKADALHPLPQDVTFWNFLPKAWSTYEYLLWYNEIELGSISRRAEFCPSQASIFNAVPGGG